MHARTPEEREKRRKEFEERQRQESVKNEAFQKRLEAEYGTEGNPKAALLFAKAWEMGHAYGYNEVETYYRDLVDLIR